jgi:hypothetical protein
MTSGSNCRHLNKPQTEEARRSIRPAYHGLPAKLQHCQEYEPDQVLRAAREKKGHLRPELRAARFLGKEAYRPASRPTETEEHQPTGAEVTGPLASRPLAPASFRGRELAAKADLDPTLQDGRPRRLTSVPEHRSDFPAWRRRRSLSRYKPWVSV